MERGQACPFCGKVAKRRTKHPLCARCWNMPARRHVVEHLRAMVTLGTLVLYADEVAAIIRAMIAAYVETLTACGLQARVHEGLGR